MAGSSAKAMGQNSTGWQVTATTVKCEFVSDFATVMVGPDGTAKCSYLNKNSRAKDGKKKLKTCKWPECPLVEEFCHKALTL